MTANTAHSGWSPMMLPAGITARMLDADEDKRVRRAVLPRIFPGIESMHYRPPAERRAGLDVLAESFSRPGAITFGFYDAADNPVGWYYGYMEEEHTHHIDTIGLLPECRGSGVYGAFLPKLLGYLGALGFERVTVYHHPNNPAVMIPELKAGFVIIALELHEEIGANIKMAYFMHPDRRAAFERAFSLALQAPPPPQP
jgi:RimJ/RimL family protein N-acetyltransferase